MPAVTGRTEQNMQITRRVPEELATDGNLDLIDVEPTGWEFEVRNSAFTRLKDGISIEHWEQPDALGLLQQLAIEPGAMELP